MERDPVRHNKAASRYELQVDGRTAVLSYRLAGDVVTFTHTGVPPELEGKGVGSQLIAEALQDVRNQGLKIVPECPFVVAYVRHHPEVKDLVAG